MAAIRGDAAALILTDNAAIAAPREFAFSDADFRDLAHLAYQHAGISLSDSKRNRCKRGICEQHNR
jgi:hypothetical protein